jgi:hypothetical protein
VRKRESKYGRGGEKKEEDRGKPVVVERREELGQRRGEKGEGENEYLPRK